MMYRMYRVPAITRDLARWHSSRILLSGHSSSSFWLYNQNLVRYLCYAVRKE